MGVSIWNCWYSAGISVIRIIYFIAIFLGRMANHESMDSNNILCSLGNLFNFFCIRKLSISKVSETKKTEILNA